MVSPPLQAARLYPVDARKFRIGLSLQAIRRGSCDVKVCDEEPMAVDLVKNLEGQCEIAASRSPLVNRTKGGRT